MEAAPVLAVSVEIAAPYHVHYNMPNVTFQNLIMPPSMPRTRSKLLTRSVSPFWPWMAPLSHEQSAVPLAHPRSAPGAQNLNGAHEMLLGDGKGGFRLHRAGVWGERSTLGAALVHDLNADGPSMQYAMLVSRSLFINTVSSVYARPPSSYRISRAQPL